MGKVSSVFSWVIACNTRDISVWILTRTKCIYQDMYCIMRLLFHSISQITHLQVQLPHLPSLNLYTYNFVYFSIYHLHQLLLHPYLLHQEMHLSLILVFLLISLLLISLYNHLIYHMCKYTPTGYKIKDGIHKPKAYSVTKHHLPSSTNFVPNTLSSSF